MDVEYLIERIIEEEHIDLMTTKQLLDLLEEFKSRHSGNQFMPIGVG